MAGFFHTTYNNVPSDRIPIRRNGTLSKLMSFGMKYDDMVIQNKRSMGIVEDMYSSQTYDPTLQYLLKLADVGQSKYIPFFDKSFESRRNTLRKYAMQPEIAFVLNVITNEAIVYDDNNFFAEPDLDRLNSMPLKMKDERKKEIADAILQEYRRIYNAYEFNTYGRASNIFKKFLVDGFLAFEMVLDNEQKNIIKFIEIEAHKIVPDLEGDPKSGTAIKIWVQNPDDPQRKRTIPDSNIIFVSYSDVTNALGRASYVEQMIRSFNILRIMETSRAMWFLMHSQFRMKLVVPVGKLSPHRVEETLGKLQAIYKEEISIDADSGELNIGGKANFDYFKTTVLPSKEGTQTEISVVGGEGPDLSNPDSLKYFRDNFRADTGIPFSRFNRGEAGDGGTYYIGPENVTQEEIAFGKTINNLRSIFQEILQKALWTQMCLRFPELANDINFKSAIGIRWTNDNLFERLKQVELMKRGLDFISTMSQITEKKSDGTEIPYFPLDWAVQKYMGLSHEDMAELKKFKEEEAKNTKEQKEKEPQTEEGGEEEGGAGFSL